MYVRSRTIFPYLLDPTTVEDLDEADGEPGSAPRHRSVLPSTDDRTGVRHDRGPSNVLRKISDPLTSRLFVVPKRVPTGSHSPSWF